MEEVVVTATPLRQGPLETAQPASVLSGDQLQREIAGSIGETLEKQLGVTGTYFGPAASRPVIRGLGGERVQVLEDGMGSLDVSALSEDHAVTVEPILAERVEIIKGPATLLYGNAAVGGVVNVLTNRIPSGEPDGPVAGALELRGDTASSERSGAGRIDARLGRFVFHADAYKRGSDDLDIPAFALSRRLREALFAGGEDFTDPHGSLPSTDSDGKGGAVGGSLVDDRGFFGVGFSRYETSYDIPGPETLPDGSGVRIEMTQDRYDLNGELREPFGSIDSIRLRATHNDYTHQEFEPSGDPGTLFLQDAYEARISLDHSPLGGWRGIFGAQLRDVDFEAIGGEAFVPASVTRNGGLFAFEERAFGTVKLELGARVESQKIELDGALGLPEYDETSVNASAGLLWKFAPDYAASVNVTRTQRHPSSTELYANGPHIAAGRFEIGGPALRTETAVTADATLRRYEGNARFEVTAFTSRYDDYIFALPTGETAGDEEPFPVVRYVQQDSTFYGFEGEVAFPLVRQGSGDLALRLASDYVRGRLDDGSLDLPQIPPWRIGAELTYQRDRWSAGLSSFYYAGQDDVSSNELPTDSYTMIDADVSYRAPNALGSLLVFVKGSNLADDEARRHSSPLKDFAPLPARSLAAGVRLEF